MRKPVMLTMVSLVFISIAAICAGQDGVTTFSKTVYIKGTMISVLIPAGMEVELSPERLETRNDMSMLFYRVSVAGREAVYGLHWNIYAVDSGGKLINKDDWWDRGEWAANSRMETSTVFSYRNEVGTKLVIILQEMITAAGVRKVNLEGVHEKLQMVLKGGGITLPMATFLAHMEISEDEEKELVRRSLNTVLASKDLKRNLLIKGNDILFLINDNDGHLDLAAGVISEEQIRERRANGESVNYFEYCCSITSGRVVKVILNYHTPVLNNKLLINKGIRLEFSYYRNHNEMVLQDIKTSHF